MEGNNVYTVGDRVKLGLQLKLRILWHKNKQRIKADHFTRYGSAEEARNHLPPNKVWGDRTEDEKSSECCQPSEEHDSNPSREEIIRARQERI
ncbi:hypothetical protein Tco_0225905, partial [Tanacetum coccineum]